MTVLALVLFLPWFAILAWAYWRFPVQQPRSPRRNLFDAAVLVIGLLFSWYGMALGMQADGGTHVTIWRQVLACLYAYGAFLAVIGLAAMLRARLIR
jgi:hypothetical protein